MARFNHRLSMVFSLIILLTFLPYDPVAHITERRIVCIFQIYISLFPVDKHFP